MKKEMCIRFVIYKNVVCDIYQRKVWR